MEDKQLTKALRIMRLAEAAAARPEGISLVEISETFGVNLRTAQRMTHALKDAFPGVETYTDRQRRKFWRLDDQRLLHMQGIRDSELAALDMGIRRAEREGAATEARALASLRNRLLATRPPSHARRTETDAEAALEARGHEVKIRDMNSGLHAIVATPGDGDALYQGGADPRREGLAIGR